ncbi:CD276 antigen-like [Polyodon spathula]|uniref:CD276 antigen-like n=1 Tax=Polyodon spathula TaxID=7913 RepID=UPI001B7DC06A|nr:CD276 antigen-like [Polyodon spathula]XP_041082331.1 CD276 antigen-like [Polyodon spathula]
MGLLCLQSINRLLFIHVWLQVCDAVTVPRPPVTSPPGSDVTLSCSFSYKEGADLRGLVVTWQRPPADHVVHSFYYGRDQLDLQNEAYRNRTQLFPEQLTVGNASLRLKQVRGEDEGRYTCAVTNQVESTRGDVQLLVAAPYSEPQLAIFLSNPGGHVTLTVKVTDGYPRPTLLWLNAAGSDITNQSHTSQSVDSRGLYQIRSELEAVVKEAETFTFELDHPVMEQRVRRAVTLHPSTGDRIEQRSRLPVTFSLLLVLLLVIGVFLYGAGPAVTG